MANFRLIFCSPLSLSLSFSLSGSFLIELNQGDESFFLFFFNAKIIIADSIKPKYLFKKKEADEKEFNFLLSDFHFNFLPISVSPGVAQAKIICFLSHYKEKSSHNSTKILFFEHNSDRVTDWSISKRKNDNDNNRNGGDEFVIFFFLLKTFNADLFQFAFMSWQFAGSWVFVLSFEGNFVFLLVALFFLNFFSRRRHCLVIFVIFVTE